MKKFLLILLAAAILYTLVLRSDTHLPPVSNPITPTPVQDATSSRTYATVTYQSRPYAYATIPVSDVRSLDLLPNFQNKNTVSDIMNDHACEHAANAGFYDTDYDPLGMFVVDGETIHPEVANRLIDGFLWISDTGSFGITTELPRIDLRIVVQNGPLLVLNKHALSLAIRDDEPARRVLAMIGSDHALRFMSVFDPSSVYMGPELSDLPHILKEIEREEGYVIDAALNLDGGSASAFYGENIHLSELTLVGGVFCIK